MVTLERPYCTLADVQLETKNSGSENDDLYLACINAASRYVDTYCRRDFWFHDYTTTPYRVPRSSVLGNDIVLPFRIVDISEVRYMEDSTVTSSPDFALTEIEYYFEEGRYIINVSSTRQINYPFEGRVEVYGEFGYTLALDSNNDPVLTEPPSDLPAAVRRATTIVAAAWSNERRLESVALDGSKSMILDNTVNKEVFALLERFVRRSGNNF
jgi:hypothetical protein